MRLAAFSLRFNQLVALCTLPYSLRLAAVHVAASTAAAPAPGPAQPWQAQQSTTRLRPSAMIHGIHLSGGLGQHGLCTLHRAAPPSLLQKLGTPSSSAQPIKNFQQLVSSRLPYAPRLHSSIRRSTTASARAPTAADEAKLLTSLSSEQRAAVLALEQHVRVIAGPGSGKTRVVAARVAHTLQQGDSPNSLLVITFTRKAAGELVERLSDDTGKLPEGLSACTFHSLCARLLKRYSKETGLGNWGIASEDDCESIIATLLQSKEDEESEGAGEPPSSKGTTLQSLDSVSGSGSNTRSSSRLNSTASRSTSSKGNKPKPVDKAMVRYFRKSISNMKNFVESTHSEGRLRNGADIISELCKRGQRPFAQMEGETARKLASVFDRYQRQLKWQKLLDYDDLLHHCLALVHNNPAVRAQLHRRWRHVLVDEGQDTNLCQFELVRQITGPNSKLFMVGDPDQAIYGFRGAKSSMLQNVFDELYRNTAGTYFLSDNYRSKQPITVVADMIRSHRRPGRLLPGSSKREGDNVIVDLVSAPTQAEELNYIVGQLQRWHKQGYEWHDMAVLCRSKQPLKLAYLKAIQSGLSAHLQVGDFWDAIEVKTGLALLRAVAYPEAASEALKRRIVKSSGDVKVPLTSGLGPTTVQRLEELISAANEANIAGDGSGSSSLSSSLSGSLLAGCGSGSLSQQEAAQLWQQWQAAFSTGSDPLGVLQRLAPQWQPPAGLKKPSRTQQAGLDRLRGLVQLATAAATLGQPVPDIVALVLMASGIVDELEAASRAKDKDKARKAANRMRNLRALVSMAGLADLQKEAEPLLFDLAEEGEEEDGERLDMDLSSSSSTGSSRSILAPAGKAQASASSSSSGSGDTDSIGLLQHFVDYCSLQGDGDGEEAQQTSRVQFMTMHSSKGKEFGCVVTMSFYEGVLPSDRSKDPEELEQERNTAYVAVTRAKDKLLIIWPSSTGAPGQWSFRSTTVSRYLKEAVHLAQQGKLQGVQYTEVKSDQ